MAEESTLEGSTREQAERKMEELRERGGPFVKAVEATRMPMVLTDPSAEDNPIIFANQSFLELCGYKMEEVLGQNYHFLSGAKTDPDVAERVTRAMTAREDVSEEVMLYTKSGEERWVTMFVSPEVEDGNVIRHFASFFDITRRVEAERQVREANERLEQRVARRTRKLQEATRSLEAEVERRQRLEAVLRDTLAAEQEHVRQKDFLIKEVNHRTKNAIAMAATLLSLHARQTDNDETRGALETARGRLRRIAEVQELLYLGDEPDRIDVSAYLHRLCEGLATCMVADPARVSVNVEADDATWGPETVLPLGLIVNEAVTNAMKYAFPEGRPGRVTVELCRVGLGGACGTASDGPDRTLKEAPGPQSMRLRVMDDGVGMPPDRREGALGLRLVELLAQQLGGKAEVSEADGGGVVVTVSFRAG